MNILFYPTKLVFLTTAFSTAHPAIDNGWGAADGGPNAPLLAPGAGTVVYIQNGYNKNPVGKWNHNADAQGHPYGYGNYIEIDHGGGVHTILAHCQKNSFRVKIGEKVSALQQVAQMGNSGNTSGTTSGEGYHVHYCVLINGVRKNPALYTYVDKGFHIVYDGTVGVNKNVNFLYYNPNPAEKYVVAEDKSKNQLHVTAADLRARSKPSLSGEVYGWMPRGFYNAVTVTDVDGYRWVKIADDLYAAVVANYSEFVPAEEKEIERLRQRLAQIGELARAK